MNLLVEADYASKRITTLREKNQKEKECKMIKDLLLSAFMNIRFSMKCP